MPNYRDIARQEGATEWDIARICWKCGKVGESSQSKQRDRSTIHKFVCKTPDCPNLQTGWIVQTNEDGSIPDRTAGHRNMGMTEFTAKEAAMLNQAGARFLESLQIDANASVEETGPPPVSN